MCARQQGMEENRYSRQLHCAANFEQAALSCAVVLIAGMGGLGTSASMMLTAAGLGTLIVCDHDTISLSNLNRQFLYREVDIGKKKVAVAVERLQEFNADPSYIAVDGQFNERLLPTTVKPQLILDCLDNLPGRIELIGYAVKNHIPLVHAAVDGFMGQMSIFMPQISACPVCSLTGDMEGDETPIPSLGACISILAGLQATEVIKFFTNSGELCINTIKFFDGLSGRIDTMDLKKDPNCIACSRLQF